MSHRSSILPRNFAFGTVLLLSVSLFSVCMANPTLEDFGKLPAIRSMSISPDGKQIAFIREDGADKVLFVYALDSRESAPIGFRLPDTVKSRAVSFLTDNHVALLATDTTRVRGSRRKLEMSGSYVFSIEDRSVKLLLSGTRGLHPAQTGLGRIVGLDPDSKYVFMPAFDAGAHPSNNLYRVSLDSGFGERYSAGRSSTVDWFVSRDGVVLAREDFDKIAKEHRIFSYVSGKPALIYSNRTERPSVSVRAVSEDETRLLFVYQESNDAGVFTMGLRNGDIAGPEYVEDGNDIESLLTNINRKLVAVAYSHKPKYVFQKVLDREMYQRIEASFPNSAIRFFGSSTDSSKMLFQVSGNYDPNTFVLFDNERVALDALGRGYPGINSADLGEVVSTSYVARDGLTIPAIITWPAKAITADTRRDLPLIVLPHGGPESHDVIRFDWLAQYFAHIGYLVLQPNFRGSTGFGNDFMQAGRGRWGKEMQDDVTDGVTHLVNLGLADPERVCIVGASYGGYASLAGGVYTPSVYRCVVSINGVSDLPGMLSDTKKRYGATHWVNSYWRDVIGDSKEDRERLRSISPAYAAQHFDAPLLLIHGKDDTVVPIRQSSIMYKAMKKAGKEAFFVKLNGEDHWLSTSEMRVSTLKEIEAFLMKYNPPHLFPTH